MKKLKSIYISIIIILLLCACTITNPISSVYSSYDSEPSGIYTGPTPKPTAESAPFIKAEIVSVVDGDTIKVSTDGGATTLRIRLLCINTEESVHSDQSKNNYYGEQAAAFLKDYLHDITTVWLQYDVEPQDIYGRELCYVWLSEQVDINSKNDIKELMLNAILLKKGYAYTVVYEPNDLYADIFYALELEARESLVGLWHYDEFCKIVDSRR